MPPAPENVCVVTTTYGHRWPFLAQVLEAVLSQGVAGAVVVDNASPPANAARIGRLAEKSGGRLQVVRLEENLGSAGGYKAGLRRALDAGPEYLWLLDDDNRPRPDALDRLAAAWKLLGEDDGNLLLCFRPGRKEQVLACREGIPMGIRDDSFLGFHLAETASKWRRRRKPVRDGPPRFPLTEATVAPYGGLLLHRSWVHRIGPPDERLFLYGDDHEFTGRAVAAGGRIFLCAAAVVDDLEASWNLRPSRVVPLLDPGADDAKVYYTVRNRARLEKRCRRRPPVYWINVAVYLAFVSLQALLLQRSPAALLERLKLLGRAMADGRAERLGKLPP